MRIEIEFPDDEIILKQLFHPSMGGGPALRHLPETDPSRPWLAYVKSVKSPTYYGAHGQGMTPQRAVDDALRQVREYLARHPQGAYNVNTGPTGLDLSFLDGL